MPSLYGSFRGNHGSKSLFVGFAVLAMLTFGLFTTTLAGHPANMAAPSAPSGLTAAAVSSARINLAWADNSDNEEGFKIGATTPSSPAPSAPSGLTATAVSKNQIDLGWTDNASDETGFLIERKTGSAGAYAQIASIGANVTSFSNNSLSVNTQYFYRVRATNASGNSDYSNEADALTLMNGPSGLAATAVSSSEISLTWTDGVSTETGFKIERKTGSGGTYAEIGTAAKNATSFSDASGLAASTQYFYRVRAFNASNVSVYSNESSATTLAASGGSLPAPSNLTATAAGNTQIDLTWVDNASTETGFKIERKKGGNGAYEQIATVGANVTSFSNDGLAVNAKYFYRVRATNGSGNSDYSNEANTFTLMNGPSNLAATAVSSSEISLTWTDGVSTETGFTIERKTGSGGTYAEIGSAAKNATSFSDASGLAASTQYFYRVRAFNASNVSVYSNESSATTLAASGGSLPAPSNLTATAASNTQIDLAWVDNASTETGFKIERKKGGNGAYEEIATVGANVTSFSNDGLAVNAKYFYRVRATNAGGNSDYSNEADAFTLMNGPSDLAATAVSSSEISLTWTDGVNAESGFTIERKTGSGGTYAEIGSAAKDATSFSDTSGLAASTQYFYRVRAFNASNVSIYSNDAGATTLSGGGLPAPGNLTATAAGNTQINLAWTDNSNDEISFRIEAKLGAGGAYVEIDSVGANVTSYSSTGLDPGAQYFYRVRASSAAGLSAYSNEANATTFPDLPAAPSGLTATPVSKNQVNLAWADNSNTEDGFKIERRAGTIGSFAQIATAAANVTSYSDNTGNPSTQYFYRVRAFNASGNSAYSNQASATTLPPAPDAPSNLTATPVSSTQINLAWTDNSATELGFRIEAKLGAAGVYTQIDSVGANITSYSSVGLDGNTQYFYRVRAFNADGNSPYSNEANATTLPNLPSAPSALQATAMSNSQINLSWQDNSSTETGFKIERKLTSAATYTQIATVGANVTSYSNTGLATTTSYTYRVRAYNATGNSGYSNTASATTLIDPPAAPSNLNVTVVDHNRIDLAWSDNDGTESGFKIERKTAGGTYAVVDSVGADATVYSNTGLAGNTQYFYQVRAYNAGGLSAPSNEVNATTPLDSPVAPSNLTATAVSSEQINLAWADNSDNEVSFRIEFKTGAGGVYAEIDTVEANVTSFSHNGLDAAVEYFYRVRAFNAAGFSGYSNEVSLAPLPDPPVKPGELAATAVSNSQIDLSWTDNSTNEQGFKIERKLSSGLTFSQIATVGPNVTSYSNTGLSTTTAYTYRARAFNAGGNSAYSNTASATTLVNPPAAPSNLTAAAVSQTQINLAWTDNATTEDGFKVDRKIGAAGTYAEVATVAANVASYADNGLTSNTQYFYRVRAYNVGGSVPSNEAEATTLPGPPAAPSVLAATVASNTQINLNWTDNAANEDGFKIERKLTSAFSFTQIATVGANVTSYSSAGLSANTGYTYRVRAFNAGGNSAYSNTTAATTLPNPPAAPSALTAATVNQTQINLSWTDNAANEAGFKIERKTGAAGAYALIDSVGANVKTYSSTGLSPATAYFYRVRAYNAGGFSGYSNEANAATLPNPPAAPAGLTATVVSQTRIDLNWNDAADNEVGFKIERKTGGGAYVVIDSVGANVTSYSSTGLSAATSYTYRLRAHNTGGVSAYSNEAAATTLPNPPSAPSSLTATPKSKSRIDLAWNDNADNETGFKLERKLGSAGTYAEIAALAANTISYADTGLAVNTEYFYRIRAHNTGGQSVYSNEANATTLPNAPAAPSNLTATTISHSRINLAWADNATNEVGFKIERKTGAAGAYAEIAAVGKNVTAFADTGLAQVTEYFYQVRAHNTGGNSDYSNEANATTLPTPPLGASNLTATVISHSRINLAWADDAANEDGFKIERKTGAAGTFVEIATLAVNTTSFADTGLAQVTEYSYRVRAFNTGGQSAYSNVATATTLPVPPGAPGNLTATVINHSRIDLAWVDNANNEVGFKIERKTGAAGAYAEIAAVDKNVTAFADTGLAQVTEYFYRIRAHNTGGNSDYSNEANATTLPTPPLGASNLTATVISHSRIDLAWADDAANEDGFKIERKTGAAGTFVEIATLAVNTTSFADTGLAQVTEYFYRVRAFNAGGQSAYSNEASATTLPVPPGAPGNLTATATSITQVNLDWADNSNNEDGFKIERKTGAAGTYAEIATVGANVAAFGDTALASADYFYRVRAFNAGGHSDYSNEVNGPPLPKGPGALAATVISSSQIDIAWADSSGNESGFKIEQKKTNAGTYAEIATVGPNVTIFSSTGLNSNTKYFYRVRAFNAGGNSGFSNAADAITLPKPPAAPMNLTAATASNLQINLAWQDKSGNETGFKIERKTGAAGTYAEIAMVGANATAYADTGLAPVTEYFYQVRAFNTGGASAYSNEANATTLNTPPASPSSLAATTISKTQIDLAWTDNSDNEDGFKIERKTGAAGTFAQIIALGPNVTSFSDIGLTQGTEYFYRVRAHNNGGQSAFSNVANATTIPDAPAKPGNLIATPVSNVKIVLTWADSSNNESSFRIERKTTGGTYAEIASVGANTTSHADSGLTASTTYFYRVRAHNLGGFSSYATETNATTLPNPPSAPGSLTATAASTSKIDLAWADNSNDEDGFKIERKDGAAGEYAQIATVGANVTAYSDLGLASGDYFYRLRAYNAGGNSDYSNEANSPTLPKAPGGLTATVVSQTKMNLAWADSSSNESSFKIERKAGAGGTYAQIASVGANVTTYLDTTLAANTAYFYRVRAANAGGNSSYSNESNSTTLPNPPAAPSGLTATAISPSQINLAWTDNANNETGFKIERKTGAAGTYAEIATVAANATGYSDNGLDSANEYFYRVRANNTGGFSAYSNEVSSPTLPKAPGGLTATTVNQTKVNLAWADSSNNESSFKIERKTGAAGTYAQIATTGPNVTSLVDSSLTAGTGYFYRVRASNAGGNSAYSSEANSTTLPNPPAAPTALTATPVSQTKINLAWTDNSNNETGFKVERKTGAAGTYAEIGTVAANVKVYADSGLTASTAYFYRVRGLNTGGFSAYSNEANPTTLPNPPASAPSSLTTTVVGSNQVNLAWTDNSSDEDGFKIERKDGSTGTFAEIATVGSNLTSFSNTGLTDGVTYFYRVRAFNTGGNSGYSNESSATPSSGSNFALNKPTAASSTDTTSATSRAVDGSLTTFWRSGPVNAATAIQWFRVELHPSIPITVGRAVINWYQTYFALEFEVQVSNDATNWTTVHTNNAGAAGTQTATFTPVAARYVRLYMKKNNKGNYRVADFEVYGGVTKAAGQTAQSEAIVPETISLAQNYPNPFNPSTTISYALPEAAHVTLKVINMTGQEVATLVEGYQDRGVHSVKFHARKLPSGVYFAVLKTGKVTETRRMMLAK